MTGKKNSGYRFLDMGAMGDAQLRELKAITDFEERNRRIMSITKEKWSQEDVLRTSKVSFLEEITCIATFFFGVPGAVFVFPVALCLVYSLWGVIPFVVCTTAFVSLSVMKAGLNEDLLTSWPAVGMVRYFSFKGIFSQLLEKDKPYILVAPPHGVRFMSPVMFKTDFAFRVGVPLWKHYDYVVVSNFSRLFFSRSCRVIGPSNACVSSDLERNRMRRCLTHQLEEESE